jgi:hypothetical protein
MITVFETDGGALAKGSSPMVQVASGSDSAHLSPFDLASLTWPLAIVITNLLPNTARLLLRTAPIEVLTLPTGSTLLPTDEDIGPTFAMVPASEGAVVARWAGRARYFLRVPAASGLAATQSLVVRMDQGSTGELLEQCEHLGLATIAHNDAYACFSLYFESLVADFAGTTLPMCMAQELLVQDVVKDCRMFARLVGTTAMATPPSNVYEAYLMCPPGMCYDGCKSGVVERHIQDYVDRPDFHYRAARICAFLADARNPACVNGVGAGVMASKRFRVPEAMAVCELLAEEATSDLSHQENWQTWCFHGVLQYYMDVQNLEWNEPDFRRNFHGFCAHETIGDDQVFHDLCLTVRGELAAFRSNDNYSTSIMYCEELFDNPMVDPELLGRGACIHASRTYEMKQNLYAQRHLTCPSDSLVSLLYFNLPTNYTAGTNPAASSSLGHLRHVPWLEAYDQPEKVLYPVDVQPDEADELWLSILPNRARVHFDLRFSRLDELATVAALRGADEGTRETTTTQSTVTAPPSGQTWGGTEPPTPAPPPPATIAIAYETTPVALLTIPAVLQVIALARLHAQTQIFRLRTEQGESE